MCLAAARILDRREELTGGLEVGLGEGTRSSKLMWLVDGVQVGLC